MRYFEITSGLRLYISAEEQRLLDMMEDSCIPASDLDERDEMLARRMVSRGILLSLKQDGDEVFAPNQDPNLWRI